MERWGADLYGQPCAACGFDWTLEPTAARDLVLLLPDRLTQSTAGRTGNERHPDLGWDVTSYVCHVGDNLRAWAERLAAGWLAGRPDVVGYDPDALAQARGYSAVPLPVALWSLQASVILWVASVDRALAAGVTLQHAARGEQRAADVARNNAHDAVHHEHDIARILAG
ncbi:hypothetical protein [Cellulomonas soli]